MSRDRVRWNHEKVEAALRAAFPSLVIESSECPGGDHDTREISVYRIINEVPYSKAKDGADYEYVWESEDGEPQNCKYFRADRCEVFGMRDLDDAIPPSEVDDCDVDYIFASQSAKNGMINASPGDHRLYADVADVLAKLGYRPYSDGYDAYV